MSKSISLFITFAVFCAAQSFTVRTSGVPGDVSVQYFLAGSFGGYGSFVRQADADGAYRIPLRPQHFDTPAPDLAKALKAIVWASGCQFQLIAVDLVTEYRRDAWYECHPLSPIQLRGGIAPPPTAAGPMDVEVHYMAFWSLQFFGIGDGPVTDILVAKAPLQSGGGFEINIPDFSKDPVTTEKQFATLQLRLLDRKSSNIVAILVPPAGVRDRGNGMKILPGYESGITFEVGAH